MNEDSVRSMCGCSVLAIFIISIAVTVCFYINKDHVFRMEAIKQGLHQTAAIGSSSSTSTYYWSK